ncbi:response regulator [Aquimarina agarivorans]|uniref:response regulator n=1 Tax=Aquimarina agarivorans TaxID=980584 RepID=UPI000248F019|nr:response regulator [Aquimarina agarivorans]
MLKPINILISEDENLNFVLLQKLLQRIIKSPLNIQHAINGKEAVEFCTQDTDLILMDIEMPIMNGFDASEILKQRYPNIPIIIQTAHCSKDHRLKAKKLGCNAFLAKPIIRKDFESLVSYILPAVAAC